MSEQVWHPLIFSTPLVPKLLDDSKTQTRRCPAARYRDWKRGDQIWVREAFCHGLLRGCCYKAGDVHHEECPAPHRWHPAIHMPRALSRITLELTEDVRIERLQDITEEQAAAEGFRPIEETTWSFYDPRTESYPTVFVEPPPGTDSPRKHVRRKSALDQFFFAWRIINAGRPEASWESNPEVAILTFRRLT